MKLLVEIPEKTYDYAKNYKESHILSLRDNSICMDAIRNGQPLPEDCEILTKEAYSDLCMRASKYNETNHRINDRDHYICPMCGFMIKVSKQEG